MYDLSAINSKQYILFAEMHGTNEIPSIFTDIVCQMSLEEPVDVGLEWPSKYNDELNAYIRDENYHEIDLPTRLALEILNEGSSDGRTSFAIVKMVHDLAAMNKAGADINIVAFVPNSSDERYQGPQSKYELGLAENILARRSLNRKTLVLTGSVHAQRQVFEIMEGVSFKPMAMHFPETRTLTLAPRIKSGNAWNCSNAKCGVSEFPERNLEGKPFIEVFPEPKFGYNGAWLIGETTYSKPASNEN